MRLGSRVRCRTALRSVAVRKVDLFSVPAFADGESGFPDGASSPRIHTVIASRIAVRQFTLPRKGTALETGSYVRLTSHSSAGCGLCALSWMRFCKPCQVPYGILTRIAVLLYRPKSGLCRWYSTFASLLGGTGDQMPIAGADEVRPPINRGLRCLSGFWLLSVRLWRSSSKGNDPFAVSAFADIGHLRTFF